MKHLAAASFWICFNNLPREVQNLARQNYERLKQNPSHPSLYFKTISGSKYQSVRVGIHYRALGVPVPDGVSWFWIGSHAEYDKILHAE